MRLKIIGLISILLLTSSCAKDDIIYVPLDGPQDIAYINKPLKDPANIIKTFGEIETKASLVSTWIEGDLITVYSVNDDNEILVIDTCAVYNIHKDNKSLGHITVEVAKECKGYFAAYPFDIFDYKVGDVIDFSNGYNYGGTFNIGKLHVSGTFGTSDAMTSWCNWCKDDGYFLFHKRAALLMIGNFKNSDFPMHIEVFYHNGDHFTSSKMSNSTDGYLYAPLCSVDTYIDKIMIYYHSNSGNTHKDMYPKEKILVGHIYYTDIK